jgi:alpha,alpha-trehalose-phosphate synthase [UDP-forming]
MQRRFSISEVPHPESLSAGLGPRSRSSTELSSAHIAATLLNGSIAPSLFTTPTDSSAHRANRSRASSIKYDTPPTLQVPQRLPRIIVASNRLPITVTRVPATADTAASWTFKMSSGGLVAALAGLDKSKHDFVWVGWVGCEIPEEEQEAFAEQLWGEHQCVPVFLDDQLADDHYNGFSNGILWPLFHYISESSQPFNLDLWKSYRLANKKFAEVILAVADAQDLVWVHDYHLMMLPRYLRRKLPHSSIGFFLHIPFPSSEVFKTLPVREDLLHALLDSNLVGFHTYDYARHFMQACAYLIDQIETTPTGIFRHSHYTVVGAFAVGIEPEKFTEQLQREEVRTRIVQLRKSFAGKKVILGVDRLDYIKGVPHKMRAMRRLLHQRPEWRDKVVLIQIAVPTRPDVPEYKQLKCEVEELVGSINGQYGSIDSNPIHYLFTSVPMSELTALYAVADVLLVTSIRDGMNLVCQEYIACQEESHGVVILSEFAGVRFPSLKFPFKQFLTLIIYSSGCFLPFRCSSCESVEYPGSCRCYPRVSQSSCREARSDARGLIQLHRNVYQQSLG